MEIYAGLPSVLSDSEAVQERAANNSEEQFGYTIRPEDVAGALLTRQEGSQRLLKEFLGDVSFAGAMMEIVIAETYKAARRKHAESAW